MGLITFLKKHCLICGSAISDCHSLCDLCSPKMPILENKNLCKCCGINLFTDKSNCGECLQKQPYFDETHAVWAYDTLASHLIQRLKFYEDFSALPYLVASLAEKMQYEYEDRNFPQVIVPVPIHTYRLIKRGFNQTDEIGRRLAKILHIPYQNKLLYKVKSTTVQAGLDVKDRHKNLKAAFKLKRPAAVESVALLDDVMTTGATVNEVAKVLKQSGVQEVHVWVLARALKLR